MEPAKGVAKRTGTEESRAESEAKKQRYAAGPDREASRVRFNASETALAYLGSKARAGRKGEPLVAVLKSESGVKQFGT